MSGGVRGRHPSVAILEWPPLSLPLSLSHLTPRHLQQQIIIDPRVDKTQTDCLLGGQRDFGLVLAVDQEIIAWREGGREGGREGER